MTRTDRPRPVPPLRGARRIVLAALAVAVAAAGVWVWADRAGRERLATSRAAIAAFGYPTTRSAIAGWVEQRRGRIVDADNGALVVQAAEALVDEDGAPPELWSMLIEWPAGAHEPLPEPAGAAAYVARHAASLAQLDLAAAAERFRWPLDWSAGDHPIEHVSMFVSLEDVVRADAALAVAARDAARLARGVARMNVLTRALGETPLLLAALTRCRLIDRADDLLRRLLTMVDDPVATEAALRTPDLGEALGFAIAGDIAWMEDVFAACLDGGRSASGDANLQPVPMLLRPLCRTQYAGVLDVWAALAGFAAAPSEPALDELAAAARRLRIDPAVPIGALAPDVHRTARTFVDTCDRRAVTALGARVLAFAQAHGRWPLDPSELGPTDAAAPRSLLPGTSVTFRPDGDDLWIGDGVTAWRLSR